MGTNNVDCCARVCHAPSAAALKRVLGAGLATNSFDDIERARTILVCGANPTENHPIVGARIKQAALRGAHLIVVDPRRIELADYADCHLAIRPGTNIPLLNAIAHTIVAEGLRDRDFIERRVSAFDDFERFIEPWTPERAADTCGVAADAIRRAARLYATGSPAISLPWPRVDRTRAGHRRRDRAHQSGVADREHREAGGRRQPAAGAEQRAGRRPHGMRSRRACRIDPDRSGTRGLRTSLGRAAARHARTEHAGDDGCGHRRAVEGASGPWATTC